jgi:hypothetical protein
VLTLFHGVIDVYNFPRPLLRSEWLAAYPVGTVIQARIVLIDHSSKSLRLTMRQHVLAMSSCSNLPALGMGVEHHYTIHVNIHVPCR